MRRAFLLIIVAEAIRMYVTMFERGHGWYLYHVANSLDERPYVYRALLPFLSRLFHYIFGGDIVIWLGILFVLSAIGTYFAMKYLYEAFYENGDWVAFVGFQILFLLCLIETKIYDYATAAFFALCFGLLARGKLRVYLLVFPLATLNRETTFLLILFFAVWFFRKMSFSRLVAYLSIQFLIYLLIRAFTQFVFASNGGQSVYLTVSDVLLVYSEYWIALVALLPLVYLVARSWSRTPSFVRVIALAIIPVQIILHLLFGKAFEMRVFAESVPAFIILSKLYVNTSDRRVGSSVSSGCEH